MPRRQSILETLLIFAVFCLQGAWPVPEVNEPYYLGKAIHYWNPHWASSDLFLQTADTHRVFYFSVGWLSLLLAPTALAWTLRLATWALLAWSWQRLSAAVVPRAWASVLTATLFLFLLQHYNMAGEWVVGGAEAKGFSFALVFFALAAMVQGYWNRMWLLLGLATAMHALVGGWAAVAAGAVWLAKFRKATANSSGTTIAKAPGLRPGDSAHDATLLSSLLAPLAALVLALPGILPPLLMNRGVDKATAAKAHVIYVFERFSHHLDPVKMWNDGFVLPFVAIIACWALLWRTASESPAARRLHGFTAAALALALIGTAFGLLGMYYPVLAAGWMRFYWFRLADVAVPLGLALLAVCWFVARKFRVALALAIAISLFHAVDCVVLRLFADPPFAERDVDGAAWRSAWLWATGRQLPPLFPHQPRADKLRYYTDWRDVCHWVADPRHTPPDARFLVPRAALTFKWYTGRGEVADWKESPQDDASLVEWSKRIQEIYGNGNPLPADAAADRFRKLAKEYGADYLLTQVSDPPLPLPAVYKNSSYVVYKMR